ncbi:MAG: hypothetical protein FJ317_06390 [SAR202 cluster bacterium]|nr:hypothetical protein [SAR202 cluster bacterium]
MANNKHEFKGKVMTVLGPVAPEKVGKALMHEHLFLGMDKYAYVPDEASQRAWLEKPIAMDNLAAVSTRWKLNKASYHMYDEKTALEEVSALAHQGGNTLVDVTSIGCGRDPRALARISRATRLNIVMGGSYYVPIYHPPDIAQRSEESLADEIARDITVGVGDTGIRSGIIGEVGCFWPLTDNQRKTFRASAQAHLATGASILVHPGFDLTAPETLLRILTDAGVKPERVVIGHLDFFFDYGFLKSLAQTGCYLEFDTFGLEDTSNAVTNAPKGIERSSDTLRMERLEFLINEGFLNRIVISHDVCWTFRYSRYGGKSYDHIFRMVIPRMKRRGFTQAQLDALLVDNPRDILTFT